MDEQMKQMVTALGLQQPSIVQQIESFKGAQANAFLLLYHKLLEIEALLRPETKIIPFPSKKVD